MKNFLLKFVIGLSVTCIFNGCGKPLSNTDVPGIYGAEYPFATETLTLKSNGIFAQNIKVKTSGQVVTTNGTWRFDSKDGDLYFSEEFMVVVDGFGEMITNFATTTRKAISILPIRRSIRNIEIGLDPRIPYKKQRTISK